MVHIEKSIKVDVPIRTAYGQWTKFEEFLLYILEGVKGVHQLDERTLGWRAEIAGRDVDWTARITFQECDSRAVGRSTGVVSNAGSVTFQALDANRCSITSSLDYDPEGFAENTLTPLSIVVTRITGDLKRFKEFIERSVRETEAWHGEVHRGTPI